MGADAGHGNDSWQATVMSYFSQTENTIVDASFAYITTPMVADIVAIRNLYGTTGTTRTDDTIYGYNTNAGSAFSATIIDDMGTSRALTIIDDGGTDTLDLSLSTDNNRVDLAPGAGSDTGGLIGNLFLAPGTVIENAIGGSGQDVLSGNDADNQLFGGAGDDWLYGLAGSDTLYGGTGTDELFGGAGADLFLFMPGMGLDFIHDFEDGSDLIEFVGVSAADISILAYGSTGTEIRGSGGERVVLYDISLSQVTAADFLGVNFNGEIAGTANADTLAGTAAADLIKGLAGSDWLYGHAGSDTLDGGAGTDRLYGGAGADHYVFAPGMDLDIVYDFEEGIDRIDVAGLGASDIGILAYGSNDTEIRGSGGERLVLRDISPAQITGVDFVGITFNSPAPARKQTTPWSGPRGLTRFPG